METRKAILESFKQACLRFDETQHEKISIIDKDHRYAIQMHRGESRIPSLTILMPQETMEKLGEDFQLSYNAFGEIPLLHLFGYLIEHEDETWIIDTDVLNWNIITGAFRDLDEVFDSSNMPVFQNAQELDNLLGHKEFGMPLVFVLHVELRDYMS